VCLLFGDISTWTDLTFSDDGVFSNKCSKLGIEFSNEKMFRKSKTSERAPDMDCTSIEPISDSITLLNQLSG